MSNSALRALPKVDVLAQSPELAQYPPAVRVQASRSAVELARSLILAGSPCGDCVASARGFAESAMRYRLMPAINASGVILHTGLGRARLATRAVHAIHEVAGDHSPVELDLEHGTRGDRQAHVRDLICQLTGAEDAYVVNNCAAAVMLVLAALAEFKEVILARGQMVEIGGSFRMPEVVVHSGCRLVEVGCTNKVRLSDYHQAISGESGAILRCYPSNFKIIGFTEEPTMAELASLARDNSLWMIDDAGSGALVDLSRFGLSAVPKFGTSVAEGAHVAVASGDKLLGGPQAGLMIGSKEAIERISRHPIARTVRVDKLTLAALAATLQLYAFGQEDQIPVIRYLSRPIEEVEAMAQRLAGAVSGSVVEPGLTEVGGGSLPGEGVPTVRCGLASSSPDALARRLRTGSPPIIGRIERDRVWLDPRTMEPDEVEVVYGILKAL